MRAEIRATLRAHGGLRVFCGLWQTIFVPAANVLQCTGKYNGLARNGLGGSIDQPCANDLGIQIYCNAPDVDAWEATAWELKKRVRAEWNATVKSGKPIPDQVTNYITQLENDYCEADAEGSCVTYKLPTSSWYDINYNAQAAVIYSKWCSRAACALEILDNVREIEGPVEGTQTNTDTGLGEGLGDALGGIGEGLGDALGGLGQGLGGLGTGLSWLPMAMVGTAGIAGTVAVIYLLKK